MFGSVNMNYDSKNDVYTINGYFGNQFRNRLIKKLGVQKLEALFLKYGLISFSFYGFFSMEVIYVMENVILSGSSYGVNTSAIKDFLTKIKTFQKEHNKTHLDLTVVDKLMKYDILDDQMKAFEKYDINKNKLHYRGLLFDMGTGTGKTFTSLAVAEALHSDVVICIVPNKAVDIVWIRSITETVYNKPQSYIYLKERTNYKNEKFIITNYENIDKLPDLLPKLENKKITVIVDESHNFIGSKSIRTNELVDFINVVDSDDILLLSGTTIKTGITELAILIRMLDVRFKGKVEQRFLALYRNPGNVFKQTLQMRYGDFSVKVTKENVGPKPIVRNIPIKLENGTDYTLPVIAKNLKIFFDKRMSELEKDMDSYIDLYNHLYNKAKDIQLKNKIDSKLFDKYEKDVKEVVAAYKAGQLRFIGETINNTNQFEKKYILTVLLNDEKKLFKEAKTIYKYPSLKVQGEALAGVIGRARIDCHRDIAYHINYEDVIESTSKKTIIFSSYIEVCEAATITTRKLKYRPLGVYGDTVKDVTKIVNLFTDNPNFNPIIATYKGLGESVPVTAANVALIIDTPFRMYIYEQAVARVWRRGQDEQTYVYIPLLDTGDIPNINSRNIDIIAFFKSEVEKITGFTSDISVVGDGDLGVSLEEYKEVQPLLVNKSVSIEELINNW